jgi:hypothetical protein
MEDLLKFLYNENKLYENDVKIQLKYTNTRKKKNNSFTMDIPSHFIPIMGKYYYEFLPNNHKDKIEKKHELFEIESTYTLTEDIMNKFFKLFNTERLIFNVDDLNENFILYNNIFNLLVYNNTHIYNLVPVKQIVITEFIAPGFYDFSKNSGKHLCFSLKNLLIGIQRYSFGLVTRKLEEHFNEICEKNIRMTRWIQWGIIQGYKFDFEKYLNLRFCVLSNYNNKTNINIYSYCHIYDPIFYEYLENYYIKNAPLSIFNLFTKKELKYYIDRGYHLDFDNFIWNETIKNMDLVNYQNNYKLIYEYIKDETSYQKELIPSIDTFFTSLAFFEYFIFECDYDILETIYHSIENFDNKIKKILVKRIKKNENYIFGLKEYNRFYYDINELKNKLKDKNTNIFIEGINLNTLNFIIEKSKSFNILEYYYFSIFRIIYNLLLYLENNNYPHITRKEIILASLYIIYIYGSEDIFIKNHLIEKKDNKNTEKIESIEDFEKETINFNNFKIFKEYNIDLNNKNETIQFLYDYIYGCIRYAKIDAYNKKEEYKYIKNDKINFFNKYENRT